ncbi:hypothetical protein [Nocardia farcinica]|uniref:hypothetical protein n=1 Tax=Nocardia farcinica TaxID=37329 RepID=UPI0024553F96|nr:hypothetical protein [Nocardia farcinica]
MSGTSLAVLITVPLITGGLTLVSALLTQWWTSRRQERETAERHKHELAMENARGRSANRAGWREIRVKIYAEVLLTARELAFTAGCLSEAKDEGDRERLRKQRAETLDRHWRAIQEARLVSSEELGGFLRDGPPVESLQVLALFEDDSVRRTEEGKAFAKELKRLNIYRDEFLRRALNELDIEYIPVNSAETERSG